MIVFDPSNLQSSVELHMATFSISIVLLLLINVTVQTWVKLLMGGFQFAKGVKARL